MEFLLCNPLKGEKLSKTMIADIMLLHATRSEE
jgi:hypothetical protein